MGFPDRLGGLYSLGTAWWVLKNHERDMVMKVGVTEMV